MDEFEVCSTLSGILTWVKLLLILWWFLFLIFFQDENIELKRELSKLKAAVATKPYRRLRTNSEESDPDEDTRM